MREFSNLSTFHKLSAIFVSNPCVCCIYHYILHTSSIPRQYYHLTDAGESLRLVRDFIHQIRSHRFWGDAYIIYACESNTGHESGHHSNLLREVFTNNIYCLRDHDDGSRDDGVNTSYNRKQDFAFVLRTNLSMGRLCFAVDFITSGGIMRISDNTTNAVDGGNSAQSKTPFSAFQNELFTQMQRARSIIRSKNSNSVHARITWDAKCRDDGTPCAGLRDDNLLALCMALYYSERFLMRQIPT